MLSTTAEYQATDLIRNQPLPKGLDRLVYTGAGFYKRFQNPSQTYKAEADRILEKAHSFRELSDGHLKNCIQRFREKVRRNRADPFKASREALPALIEASTRMLRLRPYREQVMGALSLQGPHITEMATGEGKTLTIALAAVSFGWTRFPCHIITANDYLAERDAHSLQRFYEFCGLSVSSVLRHMAPVERQAAYRADIVYTTSKEVVADFLRDRLRLKRLHSSTFRGNRKLVDRSFDPAGQLIQRGLHTAIVDEADNLLIDEAVTPLIISRKQENPALVSAIQRVDHLARGLEEGRHYQVDRQRRRIDLLPPADAVLAHQAEDLSIFYRQSTWLRELLEKAVVARVFFHRDKQYVVQEDAIIIVDDFTGRLMQGRSWKQGLQQAIEAKEGVTITDPSESVVSLSFQRFFRFFRHLSGITGTAREAAGEFWSVYQLSLVRIPHHRPCIRKDSPARIFSTRNAKWDAITEEIQHIHQTGRPILVGTRSIQDSDYLSQKLNEVGLAHRLLNASREQEEAQIIALAGHHDGITIATNMAGRGTDIKLFEKVARLGGLHVIATEINESSRIDRQLYGRAGRQGDPGSSATLVSLEDDLLLQQAPLLQNGILKIYRLPLPFREAMARFAVRTAQKRTERKAQRQRQAVMRRDSWIEEVFALSGMELGQ